MIIPIILLMVLHTTFTFEENYYTAAVFEYGYKGNTSTQTSTEIKKFNLDFYERATAVAKTKGADIIIFPEYGLYPFCNRTEMKNYLETVPEPFAAIPCLEEKFKDSPILRSLSCMARQYEMIVVANTGDIQPCDGNECPDDGTYHYNANVVFAADGTIISRYWKEHLFMEEGMDLPTVPQNPVFNTTFGSFAHFVCFDILFKHIAEISNDVDNVILSTLWGNSMPFFNSVHFWNGWALANKVNYIACNVQIPGYGGVGSGVYSPQLGALKYTFNPDGYNKLIVARVPIDKTETLSHFDAKADITIITSNGNESYNEDDVDFDDYIPEYCSYDVLGQPVDIYKDFRCLYQSLSNFTFVEMTRNTDYIEVCNNGLCCSVNYSTADLNGTFYVAVSNGTHNAFDRYFWCEEACVVVRCDKNNGTDCGLFSTKSATDFETLNLKANFSTKYVYPAVLRTGLRLAEFDEWEYGITHKGSSYFGALNYRSNADSKPLLSASLYGRCYDRDPPYIR